MPYCTSLIIFYDFDCPELRKMQRELKELGIGHKGRLLNEIEEQNILRLSFRFPCRIFLANFLIEANENYVDALIVNVWKEDKLEV